ncbi:MAG TPA: class II aldolase/adducin family protein [Xanthobacteraceae bacterium]|jgi:HCOMODA/2-hydroxy-3-carboxy-muconic semialdehyde decarboxylase|nr:class II aldolase/adducin family protein [Xanthobacteraceae bacterium]
MSADTRIKPSATGSNVDAPDAPDPALLEDLVTANRILSDQGVIDAYGHISARDPSRPAYYWISRSMAPALVTATDIIACDLDNDPVRPNETRLFFERVIHGEIYKARPDVMAVLHNHSPSLIPFCNSGTRLRPMVGSAAFLGEGAPVFDIRSMDDEGDLNICTVAQASGMAQALGAHCLVLLRGHGAVFAGDSIRQVVRRAIIAETNARQQIQATMLGPVQFLTAREIAFARRSKPKDPDRAWQFWKQRAMRG